MNRSSMLLVVGLGVPAAFALAVELAVRGEDGSGFFGIMFLMYAAGFIWCAAVCAVLPRAAALCFAIAALVVSVPAAFPFSLGLLALAPLLAGIGGAVASIGLPDRWSARG